MTYKSEVFEQLYVLNIFFIHIFSLPLSSLIVNLYFTKGRQSNSKPSLQELLHIINIFFLRAEYLHVLQVVYLVREKI